MFAATLSTVLIATSITSVAAQGVSNSDDIKGVVYNGVITEVDANISKQKNAGSFNPRLTINGLDVEGNHVTFDGTIKDGAVEANIHSSGDVFLPQNLFLEKAYGLTLSMDPSSNYEFLSFTIEEVANKAVLLPANSNLADKTVIKVAVREKGTDEIYYFEDLLPSDVDLDELRSIAKSASDKEVEMENANSETWFMPFLDKRNKQPKQLQEETSAMTTGASVAMTPTSPVPGIPYYMFTGPGPATITSSDSYGYYVDTNEWPAGSGNMLTSLIKWSWVNNDPDTILSNQSTRTGTTSLQIVDESQYLYVASDDTIQQFDNRSFLRIKNQEIAVAIAKGNTEIISQIVRGAQVNSGSVSVDWFDLIGLLPFGNTFTTAATIFGAISYETEHRTSNILAYHDNVGDNEVTYGDSVRGYKLSTDGDYLGTEGDNVTFTYTVCVPSDEVRNTGYHSLFYNYDFDVYSRNGFGVYSVLDTPVDKDVDGYYSVQ